MKRNKLLAAAHRFPRLMYHLKVLAAALLTTAFFAWILVGTLDFRILLRMFPLTFIQLELFLWLGLKFFPTRPGEDTPYKNSIRHMLLRLLIFYIVVLTISGLFFLGSMYFSALTSGQPVKLIFGAFLDREWKAFLGAAALGFLFGIVIFLYFQWREALQREQKLREEKLIFRYETLRSQVNPHFLFNSLNTLASLVEAHPAAAGDYISRLAAVYRYVLEKQDLDWVPLPEELAFARNYYELQKIRYGEKVLLDEILPSPERYLVMPISLQILLENVYKHNSATLELPVKVTLALTDGPALEVTNTMQAKNRTNTSPGTGLHNLVERSRLLAGKDIRITETPSTFGVRIPLLRRNPGNSAPVSVEE